MAGSSSGSCGQRNCSTASGASGVAAIGGMGDGGGAGSIGGTSNASGDGGDGQAGAGPTPVALEGTYQMVVAHSGKCLEATGTAEPAFRQMACSTSPSQIMRLEYLPDEAAYLISAVESGECLDVDTTQPLDGAYLTATTCGTQKTQHWLPNQQANGTYALLNIATNKCAEVYNGSANDGASVSQRTCDAESARNQQWLMRSATPQPLPFPVDDLYTPLASLYVAQTLTTLDRCDVPRPPNAKGKCHAISVETSSTDGVQAGATWTSRTSDMGQWPPPLIAEGAKRVRFQARGALGGEVVECAVGDPASPPRFPETVSAATYGALTTEWQSYSIDMSIENYPYGVNVGFSVGVLATSSRSETVYIDDIVWE